MNRFTSTDLRIVADKFRRVAARLTELGQSPDATECLFEARDLDRRADEMMREELDVSARQAAIRGMRP